MLDTLLPGGRAAGIGLHVTSLPGPHGIGDIGQSARRFIDALCAAGISVWQFLPTGPTAPGNSPYLPLSTFAGNELLIDTHALLRAGLLQKREIEPLLGLPRDRVDYDRLLATKPAVLALAAARFEQRSSPEARATRDAFIEEHDPAWLHDYALFRLLKSRHGYRPWREWAPEHRQRRGRSLERLASSSASELRALKTLQWFYHEQWRELRRHAADMNVLLFGDLPIYVSLDSADAWSWRELFSIDTEGRPARVAGVPPDYFSEDGQLWGNPLYDWSRHREEGFAWWIARLRNALRQADLVRIDHFRGFESFWSVPAEAESARDGRWEPGPGIALFDALRGALGSLPVVAENLGNITPQVEALRSRYGMPGMRVLQFEIGDEHFDLQSIEENTVCYTGTHDNDTVRGWMFRHGHEAAADSTSRQRVLARTGGTPESAHTDLVRLAFEGPARLAVAQMQDVLGLGPEARMNTPGTTAGNWEWRMTAGESGDWQPQLRELCVRTGRAGRQAAAGPARE